MLRQAQHERGAVVHRLTCHPANPARHVTAVDVEWLADDANEALLTFVVSGAEALVVPMPATPGRGNALWRTTCFELFWRATEAEGYIELNLSPSGRWAAYAFHGYRSGMRDHPMAVDPHIEVGRSDDKLAAEIDVDFSTFPRDAAAVGLSAVIEESDGTKSYWALAHPDGPPDFHNPACFTLEVPALG